MHIVLADLLADPVGDAARLLSRRTRDVGGQHAALVGPAMQMLTRRRRARDRRDAARRAAARARAARRRGSRSATWSCSARSSDSPRTAWLLRNARPVVATSYAYVNPVLAVLIGAALYGEPLGWTTVVANVLIVGAVMLALTRSVGGATDDRDV